MINVEFKIKDVPEMGYSSDDKDENGQPLPRGELLIRGPNVFIGYYRDEERTKEAFDQEGWL
jgi:long-chain acyl-CoA synthetase